MYLCSIVNFLLRLLLKLKLLSFVSSRLVYVLYTVPSTTSVVNQMETA